MTGHFVIHVFTLTKAPSDVIFGLFLVGLSENFLGGTEFNHIPLVKERRVIRDARRLLHIMSHDRNRVVLLQLANEIFDL
jgi:hypothetical protein